METRVTTICSKRNKDVKIGIIPGHFATNHSHVNYYVDLTGIKSQLTMAKNAAEVLAAEYLNTTQVDTIICLEGTEVLGAFLAQALSANGHRVVNSGSDIAVITPELNSNNQMIFRDNTQKMIWGKKIVLLMASSSTGKTIMRSMECLQYYNGDLVGLSSIFSALSCLNNIKINSIFSSDDLPGYTTKLSTECEMCAKNQKIDAIVNTYGYSKI